MPPAAALQSAVPAHYNITV